MKFNYYQFLHFVLPLFLVLVNNPALLFAEIEICTDGGENVFQLTYEACPFGVLFTEPHTADCVAFSNEDLTVVLEDICGKTGYDPRTRQFQYFPEISPDEILPMNSCQNISPSMCTLPAKKVGKESFFRPVSESDFPTETGTVNETIMQESTKWQTRRLFQLLTGSGKMDVDESLRIVMLMKRTFELFKKFGPSRYLPVAFWEDVETAFLFFLQDSNSALIQDVSNEEFESIMDHLIYCGDQPNPFVWEGLKCSTYSLIQRVRKAEEFYNGFDESNKNLFWKYDVAIEATWGAVDFVHGLCYGTFRDHINSHHMYQQAMERLFTIEIMSRWKNPYVIPDQQHLWNNFFSTNVNNALINMDIAIQASYLSTPFLHRLERPIDGKALKREKRWTETQSIQSFDTIEGYCFQTKEEADRILSEELCVETSNL